MNISDIAEIRAKFARYRIPHIKKAESEIKRPASSHVLSDRKKKQILRVDKYLQFPAFSSPRLKITEQDTALISSSSDPAKTQRAGLTKGDTVIENDTLPELAHTWNLKRSVTEKTTGIAHTWSLERGVTEKATNTLREQNGSVETKIVSKDLNHLEARDSTSIQRVLST